MASPIFTVKSFPQYLALIASQCALRKHKLHFWACARCVHRIPVALRDHNLCYWACAWYVHLIPECIFEHAQKIDAPESVTIAEVMFSHFVAEHNLPAAIACPFCSRGPRMFPDSTKGNEVPADEDNDDNDALARRGGDCPYYRPTPVLDHVRTTTRVRTATRTRASPFSHGNIKNACVLVVINQCVS